MRKLVLVVLLTTLSFSLFSKVTIKGYLYDSLSKEPLLSAYIFVNELKTGVITDFDGAYTLELDEPGEYTLRLSYVGYVTSNVKIQATKNQNKDFFLEEDQLLLDEVVVQTDGARKRLEQPLTGVERLSISEIKKLPAFMGEVDVIKAIQALPGVQSTSEGSSSFSVRGGAPDQNLILIDGAPVYNASHLLGFFSVFNNDIINDAVLYKGDMPVSHGGRLSSLLDINTKEASNDKFSGQGGIGLISSRLLLEGPIVKDRLTAWVAGRVFYAGLFLPLSSDPALEGTLLTFYDLNAKLSATINEKNRLFISGYMGEDYFASNDMGNFNYSNKTATLRWSSIIDSSFYVNTNFLGSWYNYYVGGGVGDLSVDWDAAIQDYGFTQDYTWVIDPHNRLTFGLSTSLKLLDSGDAKIEQGFGTNEITLPRTTTLESGLYVANEQSYGQLKFQYGLRFSVFNNIGPQSEMLLDDNHEKIGSVEYGEGEFYNTFYNLEPRAGLSWEFYKDMSLKASYSRTVQYIHLLQTTTAGTPLDVWRASNTNIEPETCDQFSLGYFYNFDRDTYSLSVEGYYKILDNVLDYKDFATVLLNEDIDEEVLNGTGRAYGVEFMFRKELGNFTGWLSYTYSRSLRTIPGVNDGKEYSSISDRPHSINIVGNYNINNWIDIAAIWVYATGQPFSAPDERVGFADFGANEDIPIYSGRNQYRMPDYHRLDLSVTFDLNKGVKKKYNHNINLSFYNVYARHNSWQIAFKESEDTGSKFAEMTYLFTIVPSITYNFFF